jgi:thioredoxin reductase (NADPH)
MYLARFRRSLWLLDAGDSRAARIPLSHNVPGFADGVCGTDLLERLRRQAENAGVVVTATRVSRLRRDGEGFVAHGADGTPFRAAKAILATGLEDALGIPGLSRRSGWNLSVRWCPVCDGPESLDQRIVLVTHPRHARKRGMFLRTYTQRLTVILSEDGDASLDELHEHGIHVVRAPIERVEFFPARGGQLRMREGDDVAFDILYPMGGSHPRNDLALMAGAEADAEGMLQVDRRQMCSVTGLHAAGDVVNGLHQISVAMGQAAIAATAVHAALPSNPR